jgi:uncharacterized membrane protein YeaQ/YmgE (transglycosylase-associated protein family)
MEFTSLLAALVVGAIAGWLAGLVFKGRGFGLAGNIVVGIVGAVIGSFVFGAIGIRADNILGAIVMSTIGAGILLYAVGFIKRR